MLEYSSSVAFLTALDSSKAIFPTQQHPLLCSRRGKQYNSFASQRGSGKKIIFQMTASPNSERPMQMARRLFLQAAAFGALSALPLTGMALADTEYSTYKGPISLGFSFSYPTSWTVKKKPIRTHLSEIIVTSDTDLTTTAGLVVDAVKIDAIEKFGTPESVGKKVVDVETKKESVTNATVHSAASESADGLTYYVIDYTVDSSRGVKRYLAKATVTGNQLYVFTAQAKETSFENGLEDTLARMLNSFKVKKQYT